MQFETIIIDGVPVEIPTEPMGGGATISSVLRPRVRVHADRLVLELDRGMRGLGVLFVGWGLAFGVLGLLAIVNGWPFEAIVVGLMPGVFCPLAGSLLILLPRRCEFDRRTGEYRRRSLFGTDIRPLSEIVAVQAIFGRIVETHEDGGRWRRQTYELNLVFASAPRRLSVTCNVDDGWIAVAGQAVGAFLNVPTVGPLAKRSKSDDRCRVD